MVQLQATPVNPTIFVQIPLHSYSVRSQMSQFQPMEKLVVWDDVTKSFLSHKAAILTNSLDSFKHWNGKYVIKVK